jgi:phenylalanyl-tRNA synthetase alpha chain
VAVGLLLLGACGTRERVLSDAGTTVLPTAALTTVPPAERVQFRPVLQVRQARGPCRPVPAPPLGEQLVLPRCRGDMVVETLALGPAFLTGDAVEAAEPTFLPGNWAVRLTLREGPAGIETFNDWALRCFEGRPECPGGAGGTGSIAIVFDGEVLSTRPQRGHRRGGRRLGGRPERLAHEAYLATLATERLDLTELTPRRRRGHLHLVTQTMERLEDVFVGHGLHRGRGPRGRDRLPQLRGAQLPPAHPARDMWDTALRRLGEPFSTLLRTHTSPVQIRVMQQQPPPIYSVMPGRVFRRDTADATHLPVFHQIEGLVVDRGITFADLAGTIESFTKAYFGPGFGSRLRPSYFPFTEPSAEFDIRRPDGSWLELGGCGMVHPNVLRAVRPRPRGVERLRLRLRHRPPGHHAKHGVDDLRELFTNDVRFLEQF